jgi:hypothetical protein
MAGDSIVALSMTAHPTILGSLGGMPLTSAALVRYLPSDDGEQERKAVRRRLAQRQWRSLLSLVGDAARHTRPSATTSLSMDGEVV